MFAWLTVFETYAFIKRPHRVLYGGRWDKLYDTRQPSKCISFCLHRHRLYPTSVFCQCTLAASSDMLLAVSSDLQDIVLRNSKCDRHLDCVLQHVNTHVNYSTMRISDASRDVIWKHIYVKLASFVSSSHLQRANQTANLKRKLLFKTILQTVLYYETLERNAFLSST